jgi:hypothetical protein
MIGWGYKAQRLGHRIGKSLGLIQDQVQHPPATLGKPPIKAQVIHFINKPMPGGCPSAPPARCSTSRTTPSSR